MNDFCENFINNENIAQKKKLKSITHTQTKYDPIQELFHHKEKLKKGGLIVAKKN